MVKQMTRKTDPKKGKEFTPKAAFPLNQKRYLRLSEACDLHGLGTAKLWTWIRAGYFPTFRPEGPNSRVIYVRREDIEKFIETGQPVTAIAV